MKFPRLSLPYFVKKNAEKELFVPIVCIALIASAAALFSVRAYLRVTRLLYDEATQCIVNLSQQNALRFAAQIRLSEQSVENFAGSAAAHMLNTPGGSVRHTELYGYVDDFCKKNGFYSIYFVDNNGRIILRGKTVKNISSRPYSALITNGSTFISSPVHEVTTGRKVVVIGTPFTSGGQITGTILATMPSEAVFSLLSNHIYNGTGGAMVIARDGSIVIKSSFFQGSSSASNVFDIINNGKNSRKEISEVRNKLTDGRDWAQPLSDGKERYFTCFMPVSSKHDATNSGLYLVTFVPENAIMSDARAVTFDVAILCLIIMLSTIAGAFLIRSADKRYRKHVTDLAFRDQLTSLHNTNWLMENGTSFLRAAEGKNTAYAHFDVDKLTMFNDAYSYSVGSLLLKSVGEVLGSSLGANEEGFRIAGDKFAVILRYELEKDLTKKIKRLCCVFREQAEKNGIADCAVTFSFGVYKIAVRNIQVTKASGFAETARKRAKRQPGDSIAFFSEQIMREMRDRQVIEDTMDDALKNGEFKAYIQPKVDMMTGLVCGGEALVRWIDGEGRVRQPDSFIPVMEADGFICNVDYCVFEQVCRLKKRWKDAGCRDIPISVNMSRDHIRHADFIRRLCEITDRYGADRRTLEIELTESLYAKNKETMVHIVLRLKEAGFRVSMDDFGSGYSALNILKDLPFDVIKLDKGFLDEMRLSKKGAVIVGSVVTMAHAIGVKVVCEGVETREQVDFLKSVGCSLAQGFFYSCALEPDKFEKYCGMNIPDSGTAKAE